MYVHSMPYNLHNNEVLSSYVHDWGFVQILSLPRKIPASEEVLRVTTHAISLMLKRNKKLGIAHLIQPFLRPIEELASGEYELGIYVY